MPGRHERWVSGSRPTPGSLSAVSLSALSLVKRRGETYANWAPDASVVRTVAWSAPTIETRAFATRSRHAEGTWSGETKAEDTAVWRTGGVGWRPKTAPRMAGS